MEQDNLLIKKTLGGDKSAFGTLVEQYQGYVFSVTMKVLKNREEAEEAAQDSFVKAYRALASFEQRSKFGTWLYQIAWRTAIDRYRSRPRISQSLDDDYSFMQVADSEATPEQQLQQQNTRSVIQRALGQMKANDAALLTLYYLNEQSVKEIAEITGLTESNVKVKLFRLRDTLKSVLTKNLKGEEKSLI
ncbi:MAG: sigma-70 family RNA polymerase sigma factor [Saprospiraceae bacterium]